MIIAYICPIILFLFTGWYPIIMSAPPVGSVEALIKKAEEELKLAKILKSEGMYDSACFHAQQSAELAVKALSKKVLGGYKRTHKISHLLSGLTAVIKVPKEIRAELQ